MSSSDGLGFREAARTASFWGFASGALLYLLVLVLAAAKAPHTLVRLDVLEVAHGLGSCLWIANGPVWLVVLASLLLRSRASAVGLRFAVRTTALAVPLGVTLASWVAFAWLPGRSTPRALAAIAAAALVGLLAAGLACWPARARYVATPWAWGGLFASLALVAGLAIAPPVVRQGGLPRPARVLPPSDVRHEAAYTGERPRFVMLLSADTLRADHMGLYGYDRSTSPVLDALAAEGAVFQRMYAAATCTVPGNASMISGLHSWCSGVWNQEQRVGDDITSVAEHFAAAGYRTVAVLANPLLTEERGFAQGFEDFQQLGPHPQLRFYTGETVTRKSIDRILGRADHRPTFAWVHYMDPHYPYIPPRRLSAPFLKQGYERDETLPVIQYGSIGGVRGDNVGLPPHSGEARTAEIKSRYDGSIRYMDEQIGRLLDALRRRGWLDDALILFSADHGETLDDHLVRFEHCQDAYDSTARIPGFVWYGERLRAGLRVEAVVHHADVVPTLLSLSGIPFLRDSVQGRDLAPYLLRGVDAPHDPVVTTSGWWDGVRVRTLPLERLRVTRARVEDDWKLVVTPDDLGEIRSPLGVVNAFRGLHSGAWPSVELFDLASDPGEQRDIAALHPERVAAMQAPLEAWPDATALSTCHLAEQDQSMTPEQRSELEEQLRALGYIE